MISERIRMIEKNCADRANGNTYNHFQLDYHTAALTTYKDCPHWEKLARSMAFAIVNQDIYAYEEDTVGGRNYFKGGLPVTERCPELEYLPTAHDQFRKKYPEAQSLWDNQLLGTSGEGHITWFFDRILSLGTTGMKAYVNRALSRAADEKAEQFYNGVLILLDALQDFNDKHIAAYEALGNTELAERMRKVPRYPCETFREAVQAFFMQHIVVMRENPFGGNGPGRLDYYLWPYLERDIANGICTLDEAKEIIDELFLRLDERIHHSDGWVEAIVVGGTYPNGTSAVNPLTYMMIRSVMDLDITHPSVYVRIPDDPPADLLTLCAEYMMSGNNRAQILSDRSILNAMVQSGMPFRDAVEYGCGGCMEVSPQGMTSDLLYVGWQNTAKMLELMLTGGICLRTGKQVEGFRAVKGLTAYRDFESFYTDFIAECTRLTHMYMEQQDMFSQVLEENRPSYLLSSMLDDCIARGRNMHGGGVRYHDYGMTHIALPNVADGLLAVKLAVFEQKICTAEELLTAMKADFEGYEPLRMYLRNLPKYGTDDPRADALAHRVMADFADMLLSYKTRWGGTGKPVILTFVFSPRAASVLGATADGRHANDGIAHGITPHSASMTQGITAAVNSCTRMPFEKFAGGASSMWDFDSAWANTPLIEAILKTFLAQNGQIFQGNTTPLEDLLDAKIHPENHPSLIVRVGGYSARFTNLDPKLQDEIIGRLRHTK